MSEPFCCDFEYNGNKYSIELSEEFCNEVFFKCIFDKMKQIIQFIDNKSVSFDSHVFEVLSHENNNLWQINSFEFRLKTNDLIRVQEKTVFCDTNGCDVSQRHGTDVDNRLNSDTPIDLRLQGLQTSTQNTASKSQPTPTPNPSAGTIISDTNGCNDSQRLESVNADIPQTERQRRRCSTRHRTKPLLFQSPTNTPEVQRVINAQPLVARVSHSGAVSGCRTPTVGRRRRQRGNPRKRRTKKRLKNTPEIQRVINAQPMVARVSHSGAVSGWRTPTDGQIRRQRGPPRKRGTENGFKNTPELRNASNNQPLVTIDSDSDVEVTEFVVNVQTCGGQSSMTTENPTVRESHPVAKRTNDLQAMARCEHVKNSLLISEAKSYSENNCDLIVDYEWMNVIHKRMAGKGYRRHSSRHWKSCYEYLIEEYLETLKRFDSYESAINWFPMFGIFNTMYFNEINVNYKHIMRRRQEFYEKKRIHFIRAGAEDPYRTLRDTIGHQYRMEALRRESADFQPYLETNIEDIKHFNLLVQIVGQTAVGDYRRSDGGPRLLAAASDLMKTNGIQWEPGVCDHKLRQLIHYYSQNVTNYEHSMKANNRVVEYVYRHWKVFTEDENIVNNLLFIYRNDETIVDDFKRMHLYKDFTHFCSQNFI